MEKKETVMSNKNNKNGRVYDCKSKEKNQIKKIIEDLNSQYGIKSSKYLKYGNVKHNINYAVTPERRNYNGI